MVASVKAEQLQPLMEATECDQLNLMAVRASQRREERNLKKLWGGPENGQQ